MCGCEDAPCCGCDQNGLMTEEQVEDMLHEEDETAAYFEDDDDCDDDDGSDDNEFAELGDLHDMEVEARLCGEDF